MILGEASRFAVAFELDTNYGGEWLNGHLCCWIAGECIGECELNTSLRDVLFQWERISCDAGKRQNEYLFTLDAMSLSTTIVHAMYESDEDDVAFHRAVEEQWANHEVLPKVDVFARWNAFLVEDAQVGRLVYYRINSNVYKEVVLASGEFDQVVSQVIHVLLRLYNSEVKSG